MWFLSRTGFGKFSYFVFISLIPITMSWNFSTSSMSSVIPILTCEFQLNSLEKGFISAATFAGMIPSGFLWGFISDMQGRQNILLIGCIGDFLAGVGTALTPYYGLLIAFRIMSGICLCATYSTCYTLLVEYLDLSYRETGIVLLGCFTTLGLFLQPVVAYIIVPNDWDIHITGSYILSSWRIFLLASTLPSLLGAILVFFIPESPKFLMTANRRDSALDVFEKMYALNTGNPRDSYPVKNLQIGMSGMSLANRTYTLRRRMAKELKMIGPMFRPPLLQKALLIFFLQTFTLSSWVIIRLIQPDVLTSFLSQNKNYETVLCDSIRNNANKHKPNSNTTIDPLHRHEYCKQILQTDSRVYSSQAFLGLVAFLYYILTLFLVRGLGKKNLYVISMIICSICMVAYPYSYSLYVIITPAIFLALMAFMTNMVVGCALQEFSSHMRAVAVNLTMTCGRAGVLTGNIIFPTFIKRSCEAAFLTLAGIDLVCAIVMLVGFKEKVPESRAVPIPFEPSVMSLHPDEEEDEDVPHASMFILQH
uniref:Synaptic vesicle 2-related protein n=1 Tax=Cacopsylla melanoneura TaxID=428564 RepID=A0A8D8Z5Y6_9HEMI